VDTRHHSRLTERYEALRDGRATLEQAAVRKRRQLLSATNDSASSLPEPVSTGMLLSNCTDHKAGSSSSNQHMHQHHNQPGYQDVFNSQDSAGKIQADGRHAYDTDELLDDSDDDLTSGSQSQQQEGHLQDHLPGQQHLSTQPAEKAQVLQEVQQRQRRKGRRRLQQQQLQGSQPGSQVQGNAGVGGASDLDQQLSKLLAHREAGFPHKDDAFHTIIQWLYARLPDTRGR
jgi:hypothetical protein